MTTPDSKLPPPPCPPSADDHGLPVDPNPGACPNPVVENTAEIEDGKSSPTDAS